MRSKKVELIIIILFLLIIGVIVNIFNTNALDLFRKDINEIGAKVKNVGANETNQEIALEIGDIAVTSRDFKTVGAMLKTEDENKITDYIVERVLIRKKAGEQGITVTDTEVNEYIQEIKDFINSNKDAKDKFNIYLESLGYSEEDFWSSESTLEQYKNMLIEGKYRYSLRKEFMNKYKDKSINEIEELVNEEIKKLIEAEKEKVQIKKHYNK